MRFPFRITHQNSTCTTIYLCNEYIFLFTQKTDYFVYLFHIQPNIYHAVNEVLYLFHTEPHTYHVLDKVLYLFGTESYIYMSHFAYVCKMRCPLNLVLESWEYLQSYLTFWVVILDYGLKLHKLSIDTLVMLQK